MEELMRTMLAVVVAGVCLLLTAGPARAHHAFSSEFDVKKPLTLKGTVVEWMVEGGSPNSLIRQGVTKNSIQIGMQLTIEGYQAKDATNKAVGRNFVLPDGKRLFVGSQSGPDSKPGAPDETPEKSQAQES